MKLNFIRNISNFGGKRDKRTLAKVKPRKTAVRRGKAKNNNNNIEGANEKIIFAKVEQSQEKQTELRWEMLRNIQNKQATEQEETEIKEEVEIKFEEEGTEPLDNCEKTSSDTQFQRPELLAYWREQLFAEPVAEGIETKPEINTNSNFEIETSVEQVISWGELFITQESEEAMWINPPGDVAPTPVSAKIYFDSEEGYPAIIVSAEEESQKYANTLDDLRSGYPNPVINDDDGANTKASYLIGAI